MSTSTCVSHGSNIGSIKHACVFSFKCSSPLCPCPKYLPLHYRTNKELLGRKHEVKVISERLVEQLRNTHPSFSRDKYLSKHTNGTEDGEKGQPKAAA